jgi:spore coat polysaccharide biosynthesis predicted glycosyltransferase SpsG
VIGHPAVALEQEIRTVDTGAIVHGYLSPSAMCALMMSSDLALTAGGQTLNELARCGLPSVALSLSENQVEHSIGFEASGTTIYAGSIADPGVSGFLGRALTDCESVEKRWKMSVCGQRLIDGRGPRRIVSEVVSRIA